MKKIVIFLMVLCCFLAGTTSVSAASRTYNIKELDLSVIAPKGYTVLTRENIKENRSFLKKIDMTEEQVLDTLKKGIFI